MPNTNSLIQFKRGTLTKLQQMMDPTNAANANVEDGCFYLTVDTGIDSSRLFIGKVEGNSKKVVPVNQGIIRVTNVQALKDNTVQGNFQEGDFAYVDGANIFAIYTGNKWVQINASADDDQYLESIDVNISTQAGVVNIKNIASMKLNSAQYETSFTMTGSKGISVSGANDAITIEGDQYDIGAAEDVAGTSATVNLTSEKSHNSSFKIIGNRAGSAVGQVNVTVDANDNIVLDARDTKLDTIAFNNKPGTGTGTGWELAIGDTDNGSYSANLDPTITYGDNSSATAKFINNTLNLSVYTKAEVEDKLRGLDGLKYSGTIGTNGSASSTISGITHVHNGDVFKAVEGVDNYNGITVKPGDLIIAKGTEYQTGDTIPSGYEAGEIILNTLTFDIIPSGDDEVTHTLEAMAQGTYGVELVDPDGVTQGSLELKQGNGIALSDTNVDAVTKEITIAHAPTVATTSTNTAITQGSVETATNPIRIVTNVKQDSFGHITGIDTVDFTPVDTTLELMTFTDAVTDVGSTNKEVQVASTILFEDDNGDQQSETATFNMISDNLDVFASGGKAKINFYWGTF